MGEYGESFLEIMVEIVVVVATGDAAFYDNEINLTCTTCQVVNNNIQTFNGKGTDQPNILYGLNVIWLVNLIMLWRLEVNPI